MRVGAIFVSLQSCRNSDFPRDSDCNGNPERFKIRVFRFSEESREGLQWKARSRASATKKFSERIARPILEKMNILKA